MRNLQKPIPKSMSAGSNLGIQSVNTELRITILGSAGVGKSSIIKQFLCEEFSREYVQTVEELTRASFETDGRVLTLDILDTAGAYEFPAMRRLAIDNSNAFILMYSVDDEASFIEIARLREEILEQRGKYSATAIVVVGNKADLAPSFRKIPKALGETISCLDWNHGFVEASAKDNSSVVEIFKEVLKQARIDYSLSPALKRRRQSLQVLLSTEKEEFKRTGKVRFPLFHSLIRKQPSRKTGK